MAAADACHQRMCSLRSSRRLAASLPRRNVRTTRLMSNCVQSSGRSGPDACSWKVRRTRCCWSGPRPCCGIADGSAGTTAASGSCLPLAAAGAPAPDEDDEEAPAPLGAAAEARATCLSSSAPNSWPSCVPGSPAVGSSDAGILGSLGALPLRGALLRSWATVILHSPGRYEWLASRGSLALQAGHFHTIASSYG